MSQATQKKLQVIPKHLEFVGTQNCGYSSLANYNSTAAPKTQPNTEGRMIVPAWGSIGYDALIHGGGGCGNYANINSAYGSESGSCNQKYLKKLCNRRFK